MPIELKGVVKPGAADRRYYMIRVQVDGRRVVMSSNTRKKELAERKEAQVIEAVRSNPNITKAEIASLIHGEGSNRHHVALRVAGGLTLKEGFDICLKSPTVWGRMKAVREYTRNCRVVETILGADTPLASIQGADIRRITTTLLEDGLSPATINRHLACLRRMFNVALEEEWANAPKAFPKVKQLKERGGRQYFMPSSDEKKLFDAVLKLDDEQPGAKGGPPRKRDAHRYHTLFVALIESGLRLGEALGLLWAELEMPAGSSVGMIELFRPEVLKTGKPRSVPMTEECRHAFEDCKGVEGGPFADLNHRRAQDIWSRAKEAAGIKHRDAVIHCLRHTCASRLLASGQDLKVVKEWLGHSTITTTDIYTHLETRQLTTAAEGLTRLRSAGTAGPTL